eukprot:g884.t1
MRNRNTSHSRRSLRRARSDSYDDRATRSSRRRSPSSKISNSYDNGETRSSRRRNSSSNMTRLLHSTDGYRGPRFSPPPSNEADRNEGEEDDTEEGQDDDEEKEVSSSENSDDEEEDEEEMARRRRRSLRRRRRRASPRRNSSLSPRRSSRLHTKKGIKSLNSNLSPSKTSKQNDSWLKSGHEWIGQRLLRWFPPTKGTEPDDDALVNAVCISWIPEGSEPGEIALWKIRHDDGDIEDLDENEMVQALRNFKNGSAWVWRQYSYGKDPNALQIDPLSARFSRRARKQRKLMKFDRHGNLVEELADERMKQYQSSSSSEEEGSDDEVDDEDSSEPKSSSSSSSSHFIRRRSTREKRQTQKWSVPLPSESKSNSKKKVFRLGRKSRKSSSRRRNKKRKRRRHFDSSSESSSSSSDSDFRTCSDSDENDFQRNEKRRKGRELNAIQPIFGNASLKLLDKQMRRDIQKADALPLDVDHTVDWSKVGGLDGHITALKEMVMLPLLYPEIFERFQIKAPRGVIFHGPPGTGKTLTARALANSCSIGERRVAFFMRKGADCLSKWVGEAERQLRLLFDQARRHQPSIIFFDEIDGLAPVRSAKQEQIHASIVSTLLALMDGLDDRGQVIVIGATNRIDHIDPALRRPGRFDRELKFSLPNLQARRKILDIHTSAWNPCLSVEFKNTLATRTAGFGGADLKALCVESALAALRRRYPQIYASDKKLVLDLEQIRPVMRDFLEGLRRVMPCSRRNNMISPGKKLNPTVRPLLMNTLGRIRKLITPIYLEPLQMLKPKGAARQGKKLHEWYIPPADDEIHAVYGILNRDECEQCGKSDGRLICCDGCPAAYHVSCLDIESGDMNVDLESDAKWFCRRCLKLQKVRKERSITPTLKSKKSEESSKKSSSSSQDSFEEKTNGSSMAMDAIEGEELQVNIFRPRLLIHGEEGNGQNEIAMALLDDMTDRVQIYQLSLHSLLNDTKNSSGLIESCLRLLTEAERNAPSVIYLPRIEAWCSSPWGVQLFITLENWLNDIPSSLPVLLLATSYQDVTLHGNDDNDENDSMENFRSLFFSKHSMRKGSKIALVETPTRQAREEFFKCLLANILEATLEANADADLATAIAKQNKSSNSNHKKKRKQPKRKRYEILPEAPLPNDKKQLKITAIGMNSSNLATKSSSLLSSNVDEHLDPAQLIKRQKREAHYLRELRIFLREVLHVLWSDRKYSAFVSLVDPEEVPDYYKIIKRPMCLEHMREKVDLSTDLSRRSGRSGEYDVNGNVHYGYLSLSEFLADLELMKKNAEDYNPLTQTDKVGKKIVHLASSMYDVVMSMCHRFEKRLKYDLFEKCEVIAKRAKLLREKESTIETTENKKRKRSDSNLGITLKSQSTGDARKERLQRLARRQARMNLNDDDDDDDDAFRKSKKKAKRKVKNTSDDEKSDSDSEIEKPEVTENKLQQAVLLFTSRTKNWSVEELEAEAIEIRRIIAAVKKKYLGNKMIGTLHYGSKLKANAEIVDQILKYSKCIGREKK